MQVRREQSAGIYSIHAYHGDEVILNSPQPGERLLSLRRSFIITPEQLQPDWSPESLEQTRGEELAALAELDMDVLLLGTGKSLHFPGTEQLAALISLGIGYEVMNSAAACRTFNILAAEGRRVAAAIIIEE
jgi:uncharacterized protein